MTPLQIAPQQLIAAGCAAAAGRINRESSQPEPYDDAQQELEYDILDEAAAQYLRARSDELEGIENGG